MILVIEKEKLDFSEAQRQALLAMTAKDQIYLVTRKGDTIPVEIIPVINKISARLEIRQLSDQNSLFEKGFLYGSLSKSAGKDKVVILSTEKAPEGLDPNCAWNEGFGADRPKKKAAQPKKAAEKPDAAPAEAAPAGKAPAPTSEPQKRERKKQAKSLFETKEYLSVAEIIGDKKEAFRDCLLTASDSEIGYKMLLQVNFGREAGEKAWELTKNSYATLKGLAQKQS